MSPAETVSSACVHLDTYFNPSGDERIGRFQLILRNLGEEALEGFSLCYTCVAYARADVNVKGGELVERFGGFHEIQLAASSVLPALGSVELELEGLKEPPRHFQDGPKSAFLKLANGEIQPVSVGDLNLVGGEDSQERRVLPTGELTVPNAILPWPKTVAITEQGDSPITLSPAANTSAEDIASMAKVSKLAHRLFPQERMPFVLLPASTPSQVVFVKEAGHGREGYRLDFADGKVSLSFSDQAGRDYGLTVLAQMLMGCAREPRTYKFPVSGYIQDAPRYEWRGSHLDVSRHFWTKSQVLRFIDILAWSRMNVLQWHLTDDEAWRLEIKAYPELTEIGSVRRPEGPLIPQLGYGAVEYCGHYTQEEVREVVAHAASLNIDVVPEIDVPGHATAVLKALPHLKDPDEPENSYQSVQGYPNNALNPAMEETYAFLEKVFEEVAELFPSRFVHVGGDEVNVQSWQQSPLAKEMMSQQGLNGTMRLQAYFMRRVKDILAKLDKDLAGWDEVAHGGGVNNEGTLLFAWQKPEVIAQLAEAGYDVIATPGQAYYMDMVQASGWNEPGASWAGVSTPEACYKYEADSALPEALKDKLKGVQAGIWCEHISTQSMFNYVVFPRLYAVAEAGWSLPENKKWERFCASTSVMPQL
ncbi:beta-N-acetylhexosaminidase [Rhodobacteraceae bacterium RKSG542]|uniref:beta-N-acetylhexosaminidase n=1 Tax=Pseudovibrio flavus TaxID=2529854 RepID=UPI0012BCF940|nr:beta-N-acetylhexosaminidase [Pseudovibrio flavus]MTI18082.1 beta-N-acetylhexosaminidase [Pseudovibrio flavus]